MNQADNIVVGAGSAGAVVASRLSEDPNARVILIEAGGEAKSFLVQMPVGFASLVAHKKSVCSRSGMVKLWLPNTYCDAAYLLARSCVLALKEYLAPMSCANLAERISARLLNPIGLPE